MLSRLKQKRTGTGSNGPGDDQTSSPRERATSPSPRTSSSVSRDDHSHSTDFGPTSSPIKTNHSKAATTSHTPSHRTDLLSPDSAPNSPSNGRARSSSFGALSPYDRRSQNYSLPDSAFANNNLGGAPLRPRGLGNSGSSGSITSVGDGSLTLDQLGPESVMPGKLLLVHAPELITVSEPSPTRLTSGVGGGENASDPLLTPVPSDYGGKETRFDLNKTPVPPSSSVSTEHPPLNGTSNMSSTMPASTFVALSPSRSNRAPSPTPASSTLSTSPSQSRPRSGTTSSSLNGANNYGAPISGMTVSTSSNSLDKPSNLSTSRPGSRSASITSQHSNEGRDLLSPYSQPSHSSTLPNAGTSNRRSSGDPTNFKMVKKQRSATSGITGALALSAVSLVASQASYRTPLGLSRQISATPPPAAASRESFDGQDSPESYAAMVAGENGLLSMDHLSDFEDVVSQLGTGYAVASSKRNSDFHAIFKNIPDDDYLIEDYGCALQREILIQGRVYISEHHLSFNANIFGWVTTHTLPFAEIVSIEKRMTAYVIPNAIQVTTLHARYTFASFLSRDTTYDLIGSIWRMVHPVVPSAAGLPDSAVNDTDDEHDERSVESHDDEGSGSGAAPKKSAVKRLKGLRRRGEPSDSGGGGGGANGNGGLGLKEKSSNGGINGGPRPSLGSPRNASRQDLKVHPMTVDTCPMLKNLKEVCMDTIFPSAPEKIYNLMFTSGFMKDFWVNNQKLMELQISDWAPEKTGSNLLARSMSYIKPLNGSIGPKQTKCLLTDESAHVDFDDYVCVVTTTRTPDVPSGSAFAVKTRTSMTWAKGNSCRVVVTTGVEWYKGSFIKGIIERSCIDGQKTYHLDLEKAMRAYIHQHRSEFLEEGQEVDAQSLEETSDAEEQQQDDSALSPVAGTFNDASTIESPWEPYLVQVRDVLGAMGEIVAGFSPATAGLAFVIAVLVLSNLWTLSSRPASPRAPRTTSPTPSRPGSQRHPDEIALAVRGVLQDYFADKPLGTSLSNPGGPLEVEKDISLDPVKEVEAIRAVLDGLEERMLRLRGALAELA